MEEADQIEYAPGDVPTTSSLDDPSRRFCPKCGEAWQVDWSSCRRCDAAAAARVVADENRPSAEIHPIRSSLWLYFILLGSFVPPMLIDDVRVVFGVAIADAIIVLAWFAAAGPEVRQTLRPPVNLLWLPTAALLGLGSFVVASCILHIAGLLGLPGGSYSPQIIEAGYGWATICLLVIVQPAIVEEMAFRGVVLHGMKGIFSDGEAIAVSALMFMALHLAPMMFPHTAVMGLVAGWLMLRSRSMWPCIVMHATHNGLVIALEYMSHTGQ